LTDEMWAQAIRFTKRDHPFDVVRARYDRKTDRLVLIFRNGICLGFPRSSVEELRDAKPEQLAHVAIQPGGEGISIRAVDVDISVPGLLADKLGGVFAKALGRRGKWHTSAKKAAASRRNGRRGGRPRVSAA
jgi:hypothetical protein